MSSERTREKKLNLCETLSTTPPDNSTLDYPQRFPPSHAMSSKKPRLSEQPEQLPPPIDIIAECSYEILCNVLSYLDFSELTQCVSVSRIWQRRIVSVPEAWRFIKNPPRSFWRNEETSKVLSFVSQYVEEIYITQNPKQVEQALNIARLHKFPKLKSLTLIIPETGFSDRRSISEPLYQTLAYFEQTLKELRLSTNFYSQLCLGTILSRCPNLTSVDIMCSQLIGHIEELPSPHLSLVNLVINIRGVAGATSNLQGIIRSIPNLRHLAITDKYELAKTTQNILQYCPQLSMISNKVWIFPDAKDNILQTMATASQSQGLRCFASECTRDFNLILPLLQQSCQTLTHLYLDTKSERHWEQLASINMPHLTELHAVFASRNYPIGSITSLIRRSPNLKAFTLEKLTHCTHGEQQVQLMEDLFTALRKLKHLSSLRIVQFDIGHHEALPQFLEKCAVSNSLVSLSIIRCQDLSPATLQLVASIQSLKTLDLTDSVDKADVDEFVHRFAQLPLLYQLRFTKGSISDQTASSIANAKSMRILLCTRVKMSPVARRMLKPLVPRELRSIISGRWENDALAPN